MIEALSFRPPAFDGAGFEPESISFYSILNVVKEVDTRFLGYDRKYKSAGVYPRADGGGNDIKFTNVIVNCFIFRGSALK